MTYSPVWICNQALASVGTRSTIASLTEASTEAKQCNLIYEITRDQVLSMAFWNFARKVTTGSLIKSAPGTPTNTSAPTATWNSSYPPPPWLFEYAYPDDAIQVRMIQPQPTQGYSGVTPILSSQSGLYSAPILGQRFPAIPFEAVIDTDDSGNDINVLVTDEYQAMIVYTKRVTNPAVYSSQFIQALVAAIAAKLVQALTGDKALASQKFQEANSWIIQARASDGNEGLTIIDNMPDYITIRDDMGGAYLGYFIAPYGALFTA